MDKVSEINNLIEYVNYLKEEIEKNRAYAEYIAENAVSKKEIKNADNIFESINEDVDKFTQNIDSVLEEIKKEKISKLTEEEKYPFLKLISEENKKRFKRLTEAEKEKVKKLLHETKSFEPKILNETFEEFFYGKVKKGEVLPKWLAEAPEKYKRIYESLSPEKKAKIHAAAKWYEGKLETPYQILNFWQTRGLDEEVEPRVDNMINESVVSNKQMKQPGVSSFNLGYDIERVNRIKEILKKRKI